MLAYHDELRKWLDGVDFPASKEALVHHAQHQGAPEHVIEALQSIPATSYENRDQLSTSVPVSGGQTDAEKAGERRHHTHDRLAEQETQTPENPIVQERGDNRGS